MFKTRPTRKIIPVFIVAFLLLLYVSRVRFLENSATPALKVSPSRAEPSCSRDYCDYCARHRANRTERCLCYADDLDAHSLPVDNTSVKCAMTFDDLGRLGNVIGQYAALFTLSKWNGRPALLTPAMGQLLRKYFKISLPVMSQNVRAGIKWTGTEMHDWMEESYKNLPGRFVVLYGYASSYTFFRGFEEELMREFTLKDEFRERAQLSLRNISRFRTSTTFIGVHVRRGDYVGLMNGSHHGVLADRKYFIEATDYFRLRYPDAVFLVVSNDMEWCKENIANDKSDVIFIGNNDESDPIVDFALLMNCNHSVLTIGTFGYFAALFAGGHAVYFTNFTMPDSRWHTLFRYETAFPPHWHPIAADLRPLYANLTTLPPLDKTRQNSQD